MFTAQHPTYEISERDAASLMAGSAPCMLSDRLVSPRPSTDTGPFKFHLPYHESDHVLISPPTPVLWHLPRRIELRPHDEVFLEVRSAPAHPRSTTAGLLPSLPGLPPDIPLRRRCFHEVRGRMWRKQPESFFKQAIIDMDGTLVGTHRLQERKAVDISYKGSGTILRFVASFGQYRDDKMRGSPTIGPSHEAPSREIGIACVALCFQGGFLRVLLRG